MSQPESKTSQRRMTAKEREFKSLEMRKAGATYLQIGDQLGITETGAYRAVMRSLKRLNETINEEALEVRRLELERLDAMLIALWPQARKGNQGAVDRVLRIMERRAKFLGIDAPTKQDITSGGDKLQSINMASLTLNQLQLLISGEDIGSITGD